MIKEDIMEKLNKLSEKTGQSKTALVENAIQALWQSKENTTKEIELLSKQNEQLQMAMSATKALLQERERIIQEKDRTIQLQQELIEELKRKKDKKSFFSWLFGRKRVS